jgi:hypothetical protein
VASAHETPLRPEPLGNAEVSTKLQLDPLSVAINAVDVAPAVELPTATHVVAEVQDTATS